ncbi:hypothetical protein ACP4OV_008878 [Aristida adscensionis]
MAGGEENPMEHCTVPTMAGGFRLRAPLRPCSTRSEAAATKRKAAAAAGADKEVAAQLAGPVEEGPTKRKVAAGSNEVVEAVAAEGEKGAFDATAAAAAAEPHTGGKEGGMVRLPQEYVDDILAYKS